MSPEKKIQIREYLDSLNKQEQACASGYLDGVVNGTTSPESDSPKTISENKKITIAYGTESGTKNCQLVCVLQNRAQPNW
jgi:hypothetical protein